WQLRAIQMFCLALVALFISVRPAYAQQGDSRAFAIPSQPLGASLNKLALAVDRQIMVPPELVRDRVAPALNGSYSVDEALNHVLAGSGLTHERTADNTIIIRRSSPPAPRNQTRQKAPVQADESEVPTELAGVQVTGTRLKR